MSTTTMSFALSEVMCRYIDERVKGGTYGNTSEYLRDLIRRDQQEQARQRRCELIQQGLQSGPGRELTQCDWAEFRKTALARKQ